MKIETLTPAERRREVAQLLGRALRRVLERPAKVAVDAATAAPAPTASTCLSPSAEPSSERVDGGKPMQ